MSTATKVIVMIWVFAFVYIMVDPDILDLSVGRSGSSVVDISDYESSTTVTCVSNKYVIDCDTSAIIRERSDVVQEDSYPSMIPEVPLPEWKEEYNNYLYGFLGVFITAFVVLLLWSKSRPVIEMGEN